MYHTPVLLDESINGLMLTKGGIYVDATFGGGGHSKEILKQLKGGKLFAFDRDPDAAKNAINDKRFMMINADYRYIRNYLRLHDAIPCDGILADLGISSHQIDIPERGFSTRYEGALDMRMDSRAEVSAAGIINDYAEEELAQIFWKFGEISNSRKLAGSIAAARQKKKIHSTSDLKAIAAACAPRAQEHKYLARVFQAIRIEVNKELEALEEFLQKSLQVLKPGGRIVVISYHSLEDRLVKNFMRSGNIKGIKEQDFYGNIKSEIQALTRKPVLPTEEEIAGNPRARSARLRIGEKIK
ncbi:MAG: 16S rRNA (cytosine(1402)-N(4))-methyltransferase RsmH [Bacteroidales bacterium]|nr:16S rRNA (cytosine(1402)-N(4))-methyltransferase RsmH [Bacteroidales bacterium]